MKLHFVKDPSFCTEEDKLVQLVARLTDQEKRITFNSFENKEENSKMLKMSQTGRFPVLELENGVVVADSLPIAKLLAHDHASFLGKVQDASSFQVSQWCDYIQQHVVSAALRVIQQCNGTAKVQMDQRAFSIAQTELRTALAPIEAHLKLRNFLVGHSLTLADALLVNWLSTVFAIALEKKSRDKDLPNLQRYVAIVAGMPLFLSVYGQVAFCKDATFKPAQAAAPVEKKEQPKKEQQQKKGQEEQK